MRRPGHLELKYLIGDRLDDGEPCVPTARTRCQRTGTAASSDRFDVRFQPVLAWELREVSIGNRRAGGVPGVAAKDVVLVAGDDERIACDLGAVRSIAGVLDLERVI